MQANASRRVVAADGIISFLMKTSYIKRLRWLDTNNMHIQSVNVTLLDEYMIKINVASQLAACYIA